MKWGRLNIMKKLFLFAILVLLLGLTSSQPVFAKSTSSYKVSSVRSNSNPRYIVPRRQIPVPKTQYVKPYVKKNGTYVSGYTKATKGSLKPYYNPSYQKKK